MSNECRRFWTQEVTLNLSNMYACTHRLASVFIPLLWSSLPVHLNAWWWHRRDRSTGDDSSRIRSTAQSVCPSFFPQKLCQGICVMGRCYLSPSLSIDAPFPESRDKGAPYLVIVLQGWAKEWSLDCANTASWLPLVAGRQFTQPMDHSLAQLCIVQDRKDRDILWNMLGRHLSACILWRK